MLFVTSEFASPLASSTPIWVSHVSLPIEGLTVSGALNRREESECAKSAADQLDL